MYGELVSVILVTHNSSKFLSASVESILGQTYQNLELLITDDCSTDSTRDMLKALFLNILKDCQICYCVQEPLAYYQHRSEGSVSSNKMTLIKYNVSVYESVFGYSKLKSWLLFFFLFLPNYFVKRLKVMLDSRRYLKQGT